MHHKPRHLGSLADDAKAVHTYKVRTTMQPCQQFKKVLSFRFTQVHNVSVKPTISCHSFWNDVANIHKIHQWLCVCL